jgi:anaerobic selenocysteine-containing dehydrogenase
VQVEPHLSVTGALSGEWVPIKPKTDAAFLYALIHRIVLERIRLRDRDGASAAMHGLIDIAAADLEPLLADTADAAPPRRINRKRR